MKKLLTIFLIFFTSLSVYSETYTVKTGDTLHSISEKVLGARRFWIDIAITNNLTPPYSIEVGQVLNMPENPPLSRDSLTGPQLEQLIDEVPELQYDSNNQETIEEQTSPASSSPQIDDKTTQICILLGITFLCYLISLRVGCWFALINAGIFRCSKLIFTFFIYAALFCGIQYLVYHFAHTHEKFGMIMKGSAGIFGIIFLLMAFTSTKAILDCKWRSVFTLVLTTLFFGTLVAAVILWGAMKIWPEIFNFDQIWQEIFNFILGKIDQIQ